jgi:hypothetical protein
MQDPFIREKFTRERSAARKLATEYFRRFPKDRYQTKIESWRYLRSANIEFGRQPGTGFRRSYIYDGVKCA